MGKWWFCASIGCAFLSLAGNAYAEYVVVPEIDATGAMTALSLLVGVVALVAERRRHK